ncbi:MAG: signal peptide peptidase SppA [Bacteroidales bacterium]|nr:signal peptide peptidase SppA [Bacteroidales bacterium]
MKDFVKMTLAVICGLFIVSVLSVILTIGTIGGIAAAGSVQQPLPKSGILKIDLSTMVMCENTPASNPMALIGGSKMESIQLLKAVKAVKAAAADPSVKCIYILPDNSMNESLASLEELRKALEFFRESGKPVVAYTEAPTTGGYYLASVADKVYMTSHIGASQMFTGVSSQLIFLKDLLDKLGVNVQLIRHGKYKSAGEMFVRSSSSQENMEQNQEMINSIWNTLSSQIAASRDITVDEINAAINALKLVGPQDFLDCKLVDELLTADQLKDKLAALAGVEKYKEVKFVGLPTYAAAKLLPTKIEKRSIAVIYADGQIVDGKEPEQVAGDRFASVIAKVRADSTVKAVVLRVNSPGGSVLASEKIKAELDLLGESKPLVASFGDYAASGGYWISNNCQKIFSDAVTLTGSIGVFSAIPDISGTLKNVAHVTVTPVCSNEHGDMYSMTRPLDAAEQDYLHKSIETVYDRFVSIVSAGRGLDPEYVDEIGQGRVWTGAEAETKGLVDEIGTLSDAIHWAAVAAGGEDPENWAVTEYPAPMTAFQQIVAKMAGLPDGEDVLASMVDGIKVRKDIAVMPYQIRLSF